MGKVTDHGLAGPDHPIYKGGLRVNSVLGSCALTNDSPNGTDGTDPMQPAMDQIERALYSAVTGQLTERFGPEPESAQSVSTTRKPSGNK